MHNRFEKFTSNSSESPHIGLDNKSEQAKCKRSLRTLYLDNKKSSADAFPDYVVRAVEAKHRRKLSKLYLDSKRSKITKKFISRGGASTSSSSTRILLNNKENLTPNISITTFPTESSTVIGTSNHLNSSVNVRSSIITQSITQSTLKNKGNVLQDQFTTLNRTPFANIANIIPANNSNYLSNVAYSSGAFSNQNRNTNVLQDSSTSTGPMTRSNKENITPNSCITNIRSQVQIVPHFSNAMSSLNRISPDNIASSSTLPLNDCYSLNPRITNKRNITSLTSESSSIKKMSSGKRRLIHKPIEIEPIPMGVLDSDDENHVNEVVLDATKGVSKDYVDHGDQSLTCGLCFAKLWPTEGGKGRITLQKQTYSLCCGYGKVDLPEYKDSDPSYQMLFRCLDHESKFFLKNIRRYHSMFSFTSMGGKVDTKINKGNAPFVYRIIGQNAHSMGSLLPKHGAQPKFSQLYIYDTENELANRELLFSDSSSKASLRAKELDVKFIKFITNMLDSTNMLVKTYRMVRDHLHENPNVTLKLRIISQRDRDGRTYNLPTCSEVAALIVDEPDLKIESRDIIVEKRSGDLKRISELHPSYLALQYPILFPYGDDGYRINIPHRDFGPNTKKTRPTCTMREFFAFRIQDRHNKFSLILNARRLFQQFLVDA
ncbi:uncharacterized protein LOC110919252 [Helianthus annuus]|uniref:uncharacterized protein LOC110919252 n=1 Tax=Helianthus annuus TaxID=4232 RepID=UPI000B908E4B|nr:uncharacterized protein LOC110919252 [Helianthus annuus]